MNNKNYDAPYGRREFLYTATSLVGTSILLSSPSVSNGKSLMQSLKAKDVIDIITKEVPGAPFATTVDHLRSGSMDQDVTGIVTTMFPTIEVIERTAKA